jgi:predicted aconitase with swiveling domain
MSSSVSKRHFRNCEYLAFGDFFSNRWTMKTKIKCRVISKGVAEGEAIVSREPIGFNFCVDVETGIYTERDHALENTSIKDKVLVFPHGKGSTGGSYVLYQLAKNKTGPAAIINVLTEPIIAVGAIMGEIPVVDSLEADPLEIIENGDLVQVDAINGFVEIEKRNRT